MEDHLVQLLKSKYPFIVGEFVRFSRDNWGEAIDDEVNAARIVGIIDKLIASIEQNDPSIIRQEAEHAAQTRLGETHNPDAVAQLWEWGELFFVRLIQENLAADPRKDEYIARIHTFALPARRVIADASLDQLKPK